MTLNSNPTKTPSYCESGRLAQGASARFRSVRAKFTDCANDRLIALKWDLILCGSCSLSILHAKTIAFEQTI